VLPSLKLSVICSVELEDKSAIVVLSRKEKFFKTLLRAGVKPTTYG